MDLSLSQTQGLTYNTDDTIINGVAGGAGVSTQKVNYELLNSLSLDKSEKDGLDCAEYSTHDSKRMNYSYLDRLTLSLERWFDIGFILQFQLTLVKL